MAAVKNVAEKAKKGRERGNFMNMDDYKKAIIDYISDMKEVEFLKVIYSLVHFHDIKKGRRRID